MIKTKEDMINYVEEHNISKYRALVLAKNVDWLEENLKMFLASLKMLSDNKMYKTTWYIKQGSKLAVDIICKMTSMILEMPEEELEHPSGTIISVGHTEGRSTARVYWPDWLFFLEADKDEVFKSEAQDKALTLEQATDIMMSLTPYVDTYVKEQAQLLSKYQSEILDLKNFVPDTPFSDESYFKHHNRTTNDKKSVVPKAKSMKEQILDEILPLFKKNKDKDIFNKML